MFTYTSTHTAHNTFISSHIIKVYCCLSNDYYFPQLVNIYFEFHLTKIDTSLLTVASTWFKCSNVVQNLVSRANRIISYKQIFEQRVRASQVIFGEVIGKSHRATNTDCKKSKANIRIVKTLIIIVILVR